LEIENKKALMALPTGSAPFPANQFCQNDYFRVVVPKIVIGLAVVGIAASLSQGSGVRDVVVIT
jgi:hypothetical protein